MYTSSGGNDYLPVINVRAYLEKPALEAEPGPPAPPPSRECSSGSSSPSMSPSPRRSNSGDKGGPYMGRDGAQLPPLIVASPG
jgi:hypothetical protein